MLLTHNLPLDDDGNRTICHACSNFVDAYFFRKEKLGWRLAERQDSAVTVGLEGYLGETRIIRLGTAYALAVEWGNCWQGACGSWLTLLGLGPNTSSVLAQDIPISADNLGAYLECAEEERPHASDNMEDRRSQTCFSVEGHWKVNSKQLMIDFKGLIWETPDKDKDTVISGTAVYRLSNGKFVLESGKNLVLKL
ncbi:hypothetical protein E4K72_16230 [Oxalobacteraceae bacterium OM1]|nr:hypothetical protein E4K72_16230 [Oxalobacteraceae bacterium OM1]